MATTVKYYNGITLIGEGTVAPDYSFNWTNAPAGNHAITAKRFVDGIEQEGSTVVNVVINAPASATEYMYHKLDIATTNADPVTSSTDSLTTTPYPLENSGTVNRSVQNTLECVYLSSTGHLRTVNDDLSALFQASFNIEVDVKLDDGNPAAVGHLFGLYRDGNNRILLDIRTDGKLNFTYEASGVVIYAQTAAAVFTDGAMTDFSKIRVVVPSGGTVQILKDGVVQTLSGTYPGNMAGVTMTNFLSSINKFTVGTGTGNGTFVSAPGYYKEFKIEQG